MKYKILIMTALMAGAVGCSVNDLEVDQEEPLKIVFAASPFEDGDKAIDTKTSVIPNESYSSYEFIWSAKDTVGIYPDVGSQIYFTMENGAGASSASFDGGAWTCKEGHTFRSYYPFIGTIYLDATQIPVSFTGQKQVGNDNSDHFQKYDYMYTAATTKEGDMLNFAYNHLITAVLPWVELPAGHYTGLTLSLDEELFVTKGKYDLTADTPAIVGQEYSNTMSIELDITFSTPDILKVYVPLAPMDMSGKTLTITITDEIGKKFQYTYNPSKPYRASMIYRLRSAASFADAIAFADDAVKAICVANWDTNEDGELSYTEAAAVTSFSNSLFAGNTTITSFDELQYFTGMTYISSYAFQGCTNITSITIPESVTRIEKYAFYQCSSLSSFVFPEGLRKIENGAFGHTALKEISLPSTLVYLRDVTYDWENHVYEPTEGPGAFAYTDIDKVECYLPLLKAGNITSSRASSSNSYYVGSEIMSGFIDVNYKSGIGSGWNSKDRSTANIDEITIKKTDPEETYILYADAFSGFSGLRRIVLPDGIDGIDSAFIGCISLEEISLPEGITFIGSYSFYNCSSLPGVNIPNTVTSIGYDAFSGCSSMVSVIIPEGVTTIQDSAFAGCSNLSMTVLPTTPPTVSGSSTFSGVQHIYVKADCVDVYKQAAGWSSWSSIIEAISE